MSRLRVLTPVMRENDYRHRIAMIDALSAAVLGAIAGYLMARHSPEIEWILRTVTG